MKIADFAKNGWPKSKSNTGNGFLGFDHIYLDNSYVPIATTINTCEFDCPS